MLRLERLKVVTCMLFFVWKVKATKTFHFRSHGSFLSTPDGSLVRVKNTFLDDFFDSKTLQGQLQRRWSMPDLFGPESGEYAQEIAETNYHERKRQVRRGGRRRQRQKRDWLNYQDSSMSENK